MKGSAIKEKAKSSVKQPQWNEENGICNAV